MGTDYDQLKARLSAPPTRTFVPPSRPRERLAVMSCIHANLAALQAVMQFLDETYGIGPDRVVCLGDLVGFGPDPVECVDIARGFRLCLMGNHDEHTVNGAHGFNPAARRSVLWQRDQLRPRSWFATRNARERWRYVSSLPHAMQRIGPWQCVHGSPRDPTMEYVLPVDVRRDLNYPWPPPKMVEIFSMFDKVLFVGHTHVAGVINDRYEFLTPDELGHEFELDRCRKALINVGSVGQPRDEDPRACVVVIDESSLTVRWHRVPYDVEQTAQRIDATPEIDNMHAERLRRGL